MKRIPVTVLTGFLGAGKTTLLNRVLREQPGRRYAVVVNEYGALGIDGALVVGAEDEVIELNNGCLCCKVRRLVFHGVHMSIDTRFDRPWKAAETRDSRLVFIGRNLDRSALDESIRHCEADS